MNTDIHVCKESETSETPTSSSCICGPEYYCHYFCPEGDSVSTLISWQHFPRSTSSRSHCDDSEEIPKVWSDTIVQSAPKEEAKELSEHSSEYPITKSFSQLDALHYLEIRQVFKFFNFLISHLVCNEPEDPIEFLHQLLNRCLKYRDSFGEPPLLFTRAHIKSLYNAFDPFEKGYLTESQYTEALKSLGLENSITPHDKESLFGEDGCIDEKTFVFEAEKRLGKNLDQMLRIPKIWEENRRMWKRKIDKKNKKLTERENTVVTSFDKMEKNTSKMFSKEFLGMENPRQSCCITNFKYEPEQLFLK